MFYIRLAWTSMKTKKWISGMVLFSLALAYLLPMMLITGIQGGLEQLQTEKQKDMDRVLRYTRTNTVYEEGLREQMQAEVQQDGETEAVSCVFNAYLDVVLVDAVQKCMVYAIDENYDLFYDFRVTPEEGQTVLFDGEEKVCVLGEELYQKCHTQEKAFTEIVVNGTAYRIVGKVNREGIYVPYQSLKQESKGTSYVFFKLPEGKENLTRDFSSLAGYYMEWESERQEMIISATLENMKTIGAILMVLFFVVILNLLAIWREQYVQLQSVIGIKRAVGVSRGGLFLEQMLQSLFLSVGAIAVIYLFSPLLNRLFYGFGEIRFSFTGLLMMLVTGSVLSLIQASVVTILIYHRPVRIMLEDAA